MGKRKKIMIAGTLVIMILLVASGIYFFEFSMPGYRISVAMHGFDEISENVYTDQNWDGDTELLLRTIGEARERVIGFFGETRSNPFIIICDDKRKLARLGGDHDTFTVMFIEANSYISISSEWLNVDVLAHELTHAEIHTRVFQGGISLSLPIPTWFDEGLAIQNDYREQYSYKTWLSITDNGESVPSVEEYNTATEFYAGKAEDRRTRYCLTGHEISTWIERNGKDTLIMLLDKISRGNEFSNLYSGD